ncbi:MAG: glycosyltransferase [Hyphomicrobium sp.]|nr:glycosyltransferase [Hyphomicrobium sp.]
MSGAVPKMQISSTVLLPDLGSGGIHSFYAPSLAGNLIEALHPNAIDADPFTRTLDDTNNHLPLFPRTLSRYLAVANDAYVRGLAKGADILEVCDWPLGFVPAVLEQRIPYIVQCHGSMGQLAEHDPQQGADLEQALVQLIEPQLLRCAHRVQTYSRANQRFWEHVTGRAVDMIRPAFPLPQLPSDLAIENVGRVFGRLQRWKGPHILCEALRLLESRGPQIRWHGGVKPWASGEWPADRRLAVDFPGVWGVSLHHAPAIPREHVFALQATAMFNVVPSTWDVFNFTAVESMAAARPTIVSTGAGASELIIDGENGFTFEAGSAKALAAVIDRVLSMPERRRREIGAAGRETIRIDLDPARIAEQRLAAYDEAIRSFHASRPQKPNDWLIRMLKSEPNASCGFEALLDPVPLRAMGGHFARRVAKKLLAKSSR